MSSKSILIIFELYRFKVGAYFETQCICAVLHAILTVRLITGSIVTPPSDIQRWLQFYLALWSCSQK